MERRDIIIDNVRGAELETENVEVRVLFSVFGNPDYLEVSAVKEELTGERVYAIEEVEYREGVSDYETTLIGLWSGQIYKLKVAPVVNGPDGEPIYKYDDGYYVLNDLKEIYFTTKVKLANDSVDELHPAPSIRSVISYPKMINAKSGIEVNWESRKYYDNYDLLIRVHGDQSFATIPTDVEGYNGSFNLASQKFYGYSGEPYINHPFDFVMSHWHNPVKFEVQVRGTVNPVLTALRYYSQWSSPRIFLASFPHKSLRGFFMGQNLANGIRNYFPQSGGLSLRKEMQADDI